MSDEQGEEKVEVLRAEELVKHYDTPGGTVATVDAEGQRAPGMNDDYRVKVPSRGWQQTYC